VLLKHPAGARGSYNGERSGLGSDQVYLSVCRRFLRERLHRLPATACYSARQMSIVLVDMLVNRGRPLCLTAGRGIPRALATSSVAQ
jgi:hypothetical protein